MRYDPSVECFKYRGTIFPFSGLESEFKVYHKLEKKQIFANGKQ